MGILKALSEQCHSLNLKKSYEKNKKIIHQALSMNHFPTHS